MTGDNYKHNRKLVEVIATYKRRRASKNINIVFNVTARIRHFITKQTSMFSFYTQ